MVALSHRLAASPVEPAPASPFMSTGWDERVTACKGASLFHSTPWAKVLSAVYGFEPLYLAVPGDPGTALPLMDVTTALSRRRGVSLPFTDECEPLVQTTEQFAALFRQVLATGRQRRWHACEFRGGDKYFCGAPASAQFYGHEVLLSSGIESALPKATRGAIKKARQSGVTVEFATDAAAMDSFYQLLCQTRQRHGSPPQPRAFFEAIRREILDTGNGLLLLAKHQSRPVAGAVFFHFGHVATYKYAASDAALKHLSANNLVLWTALEWYASRGFDRMQLGRTAMSNEGLRAFKRSWGAREYTIRYFRYLFAADQFASGGTHSSAWQKRIGQLMPRTLSRYFGQIAYKHAG